jgi:hypothetical protein
MAEEVKMLGTSEVAKKLKIEPKKLRTILRKAGIDKGEGRYAWKPTDSFLTTKLPKLIAEYEAAEKEEKTAKKSAPKKAAKKATKKAAKKDSDQNDEPEEI